MDRSNKSELRHKLLDYIDNNYVEIYSPLLIPNFSETERDGWGAEHFDWNHLYLSGNRRMVNHNDVRELPMTNNVTMSTTGRKVLEFGCNTAYFSFLACKENAKFCLGIDTDEVILGLNQISKEISGYKNIEFEHLNMKSYSGMSTDKYEGGDSPFVFDEVKKQLQGIQEKHGDFDVLICYSIWDFDFYHETDFLNDITDLFKIKDIWFEPTNHHHISVKEYDEWTQKYVEKFGNVRMVGTTDYQDRPLYLWERVI